MHPTEEVLTLSSLPAPFGFGHHPKFERSFRTHLEQLRQGNFSHGEVSLSQLADSRHPEVFIIPRDRLLYVVDEWGDTIGFEKTILPFSSTDFYADRDEEGGLFCELDHSEAFFRLGGISQLGYLVPPRPDELDKSVSISYMVPPFSHTRWVHSLLVAILMEIILSRNGFSKEERDPVVLTAGSHDIATPAGGDSIKRVDPKNLHEEEGFAWVLEHHGLAKRWAEQFGFNLSLAKDWVKGRGIFGQLLDVLDKISYTALDCYQLGRVRPGEVRSLCLKHPLIVDVWQDIQFTPDRANFFFSRPERLFRFLLLRAYEYQELLFNPYSRALDLFLKKLVQPLYRKGIITKEQLLTGDDKWLERVLDKYYPEEIKGYIEPEELSWKRFGTAREQREFAKTLGKRADHAERIAGFSTGLDWSVLKEGKIVSLRETTTPAKVKLLERIVASTRGYYVYYT